MSRTSKPTNASSHRHPALSDARPSMDGLEPPRRRGGSDHREQERRQKPGTFLARLGLGRTARRTLGIGLLMATVMLWTLSNFLASAIFSGGAYDKPFFLVYINSSIFAVSLVPQAAQFLMKHGVQGTRHALAREWRGHGGKALELQDSQDVERLLPSDGADGSNGDENNKVDSSSAKLSMRETMWLSLEFCMLWFCANYFASACLSYTSVGSVTILTSTSSIWTLVFCALFKVEGFTVRKLLGVLASLAGIVLISTVDLSGASDDTRGNFPHKTWAEIAIGDSMAFFSAVLYGLYVTVMKRRVGDEDHVNMPLFFGFVGLLNLLFLWPLFPILHWTGVETFEGPPSSKIWLIIWSNSLSSFISDLSWAYAMLLTTPLVVTVGLSMTIPVSLVGEMIQYQQYASWIYWVGAGIVLLSFLFINNESQEAITATLSAATSANSGTVLGAVAEGSAGAIAAATAAHSLPLPDHDNNMGTNTDDYNSDEHEDEHDIEQNDNETHSELIRDSRATRL